MGIFPLCQTRSLFSLKQYDCSPLALPTSSPCHLPKCLGNHLGDLWPIGIAQRLHQTDVAIGMLLSHRVLVTKLNIAQDER